MSVRLKEAETVDETEFAQRLRDITPRLVNVASGYLSSRKDAEDLAGDVVARAWSRRHQWLGQSFDAWVFRIFHTQRVDRIREKEKRPEVDADTELVEAIGADQSRSNPEQSLIAQQKLKAIWDQLPPEFRDVIIQVKVNGYEYKEAAEILNVPIGTVMSRLFRARRIIDRLKAGSDD